LSWSLIGPTGTLINQRNFTGSDSVDISSNPVLNLNSGSYTLFVTGGGSPNYSFRLSDLASATPITLGTAVSGSLNPGNSSNLYKFNANAGDLIYFDEQTLSNGNTYWRLIDPNGQQVWLNSFSDVATLAMPSTGTYTLLVEGRYFITSPVTYSFNLDFVPLAPPIQITGIGLQPAPYLLVTNLAVAPVSGPLQSGAEVTVSWNDTNNGNLATSGSWTDRVVVTNANNQVIASVLVPYDQTVSGPLAVGGSSQRQATITLPDGLPGSGTMTFSVTLHDLLGHA
jgi:hypothetical protein